MLLNLKNFDRILFGFILGVAFPFSLCLISIIIWFLIDRRESAVFIYLIPALLLGLLINIKFLKNWINKRYELSTRFLILIYIICNIGIYGFFMGFPVFNIILGLVAGYYFGKRISFMKMKSEVQPKIINHISLFTGLIMTLFCISTGIIALSDNYTGSAVKSILGLSFEVTKEMILTIIIFGGLGLIISQYFITKLTMQRIIKFNNRIT